MLRLPILLPTLILASPPLPSTVDVFGAEDRKTVPETTRLRHFCNVVHVV